MFSPEMYRLLDFGRGRRLEAFGSVVLDRPCPAVEAMPQTDPSLWQQAHARFEQHEDHRGRWVCRGPLPERWTISHGRVRLELKRTAFGHLGVFAEQAANWDWIAERVARWKTALQRPLKVLNLFAYTGGATLAAAAAGAEVVHADAARNTVAWARRNADRSGLGEAPIRWIVDDAAKFVRREVRRDSRYDGVILDPPSYGHGARGEVWRLGKHLPGLLAGCARLTAGRRRFLLLSSHTPGLGPARFEQMVEEALGDALPGRTWAGELTIRAVDGRNLPSGVAVRWEAESGEK